MRRAVSATIPPVNCGQHLEPYVIAGSDSRKAGQGALQKPLDLISVSLPVPARGQSLCLRPALLVPKQLFRQSRNHRAESVNPVLQASPISSAMPNLGAKIITPR